MTQPAADMLLRRVRRLSRQDVTDRLHAVRALSGIRGLRYIDDLGRPRTIELALVPWLLSPAQLAFFQRIARDLLDALLRIPSLYAKHPSLREILQLDPAQESWIRLASHPRSRPWAVMGRLDSTAVFEHAHWQRRFELLEPNAVGVGGVHYAPTACSIIHETLGDVMAEAFPGRRVVPTPDPRRLLTDELAGLSKRLGRPLRRIALVENSDFTTGTDEFLSLACHYNQNGLQAIVADPREIRVAGGRLTVRGLEVDLLYRDCELNEFVQMEQDGKPLTGLRAAIRDGRMVSGLLWEFDHKSCWEILTDPTYAGAFTPRQRRLFRDYLPWTRLVRATKTFDPKHRLVDLPDYIRRHRRELVLKPNTLYGGQGVAVGHAVTQHTWERTLAKALRGQEPYVVQSLARIATHRFPRLEDGGVHEVERRVVSGFFFTSSEIGLVGRFSKDPVVNVSRGGGLVAAFLVS